MRITMIGHSTVLIEAAETKILTDPYFGTWGNPGYARIAPPSRSREELKGKVVIPIHLGITPRSPLLRTSESPEGFMKRLREAGSPAEVKILREGESWE